MRREYPNGFVRALRWAATMSDDADELLDAADEIERSHAAIRKANAQAEHFEREWYLRGDEIERLHEQVQDMIDASGQQCGCGYDKPDDVCLGHWPAYKKQQAEIERLKSEVATLKGAIAFWKNKAGITPGGQP